VRNDASVLLDCDPNEIALNINQISTHTKVYIGRLSPRFFNKFGYLEHIYTSFPDGEIKKRKVVITQGRQDLLKAMKDEGINIFEGPTLGTMGEKLDSIPTQSESERSFGTQKEVYIVRIKVQDLNFGSYDRRTRFDVYDKAKKLGLQPCPVEAALQYCLEEKQKEQSETNLFEILVEWNDRPTNSDSCFTVQYYYNPNQTGEADLGYGFSSNNVNNIPFYFEFVLCYSMGS
jgi:hypothetical protein